MGVSPESYAKTHSSGESDSRRLLPWQGNG